MICRLILNTYIHTYVHIYIYTFIHSFIHSFCYYSVHSYIHKYIYTELYIHTYSFLTWCAYDKDHMRGSVSLVYSFFIICLGCDKIWKAYESLYFVCALHLTFPSALNSTWRWNERKQSCRRTESKIRYLFYFKLIFGLFSLWLPRITPFETAQYGLDHVMAAC